MLNEKALEAAAIKYDLYANDIEIREHLKNHAYHHVEAMRSAIQAYLASVREQVDVEEVIANVISDYLCRVDCYMGEHRTAAVQVITAMREKGVGI